MLSRVRFRPAEATLPFGQADLGRRAPTSVTSNQTRSTNRVLHQVRSVATDSSGSHLLLGKAVRGETSTSQSG